MRKRLAIFALLLAAVMLALPSQALAAGHWADSAVTALNKIYGTSVFVANDNTMTASEAGEVLKAMGVSSEKLDTQADFTRSVACDVLADVFDLPVGDNSAITYLYGQNIISGTSEDNLDENGTVSKAQFAVLTYRVLNSVGGGLGSSTDLKPGTDEYFAWMYLAARNCVSFDTESTKEDITEEEWDNWVSKLKSLPEESPISGFSCEYPEGGTSKLNAAKTIVAAYIGAGGPSTIFSDVVPGDYEKGGAYYDGVMYLFDRRIVSGNGNGTFGPDNELPRNQLAVLLCRLDNQDCKFDEAPNYAVTSGYISAPLEADNDWWNATATREEVIVAFMKQAKVDVANVNTGILDKFSDDSSISDDAKPYLAYAVSLGLVKGTGDGKLEPGATVTRGQAGVLLYRTLLGVDKTKMEDYRLSVASVLGNENASISLLSESKQLDLRETWRLTSDLEANVPEDTTLTISGTIYEMGGKLINTGEGKITFAEGFASTPVFLESVAKVGDTEYTSLSAAINNAADGQTVTLLKSSTGNAQVKITDGKKITLDMNGFDAGFAFKANISVYHGDLNIVGNGKLYEESPYFAPVMLYGSNTSTDSNYTLVTVGRGVTLEGWAGLFIDQLESNSNGANAFGVVAEVYGTLSSKRDTDGYGGHALYINGTIKATEGNIPQITLDGATLEVESGNGMYLAGYAETTISNTEITADTGIEIRAGKLAINDGTTIVATAVPTSVTPNGNGSTTDGAGVAVAQHTTKLPINVTISGGTISGYSALYQSNPQNNDEESIAKVTMSVTGGNFQAISGGTVSVYSQNKTGFISGGYFTSDPSAYVADERVAVESDEPGYNFMVVEKRETAAEVVAAAPSVADPELPNDATEADTNLALAVKNALTAEDEAQPSLGQGALEAAANAVANDNNVTEEQGKTALQKAQIGVNEGDSVTIVIQPYLDIKITGAVADKSITLDITPMYRTVATTADLSDPGYEIVLASSEGETTETDNAVQIGDAAKLAITKPVTVTVPLPAGFVSEGTSELYVKHVKSASRTYFYSGTVASNVLTFTNPHGFSEFTIMSESGAEAELNGIGYDTLTNALADAKDGDTIKVLASADATMSGASRTVTLENGTSESITVTINGKEILIDGGKTETFAYTAPSGGGSVATTYTVTVAEAENGKVTVSATSAAEGDTVTVTAVPAEGYEVASVAVTYGDEEVEVADNGDGTYSFEMPAADVTVAVAFEASAPVVELPFTDVSDGDWYYGPVAFVYAKGLMTGYEGTTLFGPEDALGREQAAAVLFRALGAGAQAPAAGMADVDQGAWYAQAVNWAVASGLLTGYADGSGLFGVGDALTRDQFAAIVARVAGADLSQADPSALDSFSDGGEVAEWAVPAVSWAAQVGILEGSDDGEGGMELRSSAEITRGEMATMIQRAAEAGLLPTA